MLIVENGKEIQGANSYVTVDEVDAWQGLRGNSDWPQPPEAEEAEEPEDPGEQPEEPERPEAPEPPSKPPDPNLKAKIAAIVKATDYLNGLNWTGRKRYGDSPDIMAWPRDEATDEYGVIFRCDKVPDAVKAANCYLAGIVYTGTDLQPILERGGRISSEKVGSLATTYFQDATNRDIYSTLADLLHGYCYDFRGLNGPGIVRGKTVVTTGSLG